MSIAHAFALLGAYVDSIDDAAGYWCPCCGACEAFHPEACSITPEEWRERAAEAKAWLWAHPCDCCAITSTRAEIERRHGTLFDLAAALRDCEVDRNEARRAITVYRYRLDASAVAKPHMRALIARSAR